MELDICKFHNENTWNLLLKHKRRNSWLPIKSSCWPLVQRGIHTTPNVFNRGEYFIIKEGFVILNDKTKKRLAIKTIRKLIAPRDYVDNVVASEIKAILTLRHANIMQVDEIIEYPLAFHVVFGECPENGSLLEYVNMHQGLPEGESRRLFIQIISVIEFCHDRSICHGDIKLDTMMLDEHYNIKLIDFGFSCFPDDYPTQEIPHFGRGTPNYVAPEILEGESIQNIYKIDIWNAGVCLYAMLCGKFPFTTFPDPDIYLEAIRRKLQFIKPVTSYARKLTRRLLQVDPTERPSSTAILHDDWVKLPFPVDNSKLRKKVVAKVNKFPLPYDALVDEYRFFQDQKHLMETPAKTVTQFLIAVGQKSYQRNYFRGISAREPEMYGVTGLALQRVKTLLPYHAKTTSEPIVSPGFLKLPLKVIDEKMLHVQKSKIEDDLKRLKWSKAGRAVRSIKNAPRGQFYSSTSSTGEHRYRPQVDGWMGFCEKVSGLSQSSA